MKYFYPCGPQDALTLPTHYGAMAVPVFYPAFRHNGLAFYELTPGEWRSFPANGLELGETDGGMPLLFSDNEGSDTPELAEFLSERRDPVIKSIWSGHL